MYCSNSCKFKDKAYNESRGGTKKKIFNKVAVCNECSWETKDCQNLGGHARKHIETEHPNIEFVSVKKNYTLKNAKERDQLECPECGWTTFDTDNKSGIFTRHIRDKHNKTIIEWVELHPHFNSVFNRLYSIQKRNESSSVICKLCGEEFQKISNTHLVNIHGITTEEYKERFPFSKIVCERIRQIHSEHTTEMNKNSTFKRQSSMEIELSRFLSKYVDVIECDRSYGVEFDILIPEKNLAIEVDGILYHSENFGGKGKTYHLDKTTIAESNGIHLIHLFEDEWLYNKELVLNKLLYMVGESTASTKVFARKCEIHRINDVDTVRSFLNSNHIQGARSGKYTYGAYYDGSLVAVSIFGNLRKALGSTSKDGVYELIRYCTHADYICVGLFSKMVSNFIKEVGPDEIISYADRRWSSSLSNMYEKSGFTFEGTTKPNYWYLINRKRRHRYGFTKHKIIEMGGDPNKSEWDNMLDNGYDRIWDCGTLKYSYKPNQ